MYFCPKCSYLLDIGKISSEVNNSFIAVSKPTELFKLLEKKDINIKTIKYEGSKDELIKNKNYSKLSQEQKNIINSITDPSINLNSAEFKCFNCNYSEPILNTVILYSLNFNDKEQNESTIEKNKLFSTDPLLPHTRDYTCKNSKCPTHDDTALTKKDAVFYKNKGSYRVIYICCVCYYSW